MRKSRLPPDGFDPRLVRLVARHFSDLCGYGTAFIGAALAVPALVYASTGNAAQGGAALCASAPSSLVWLITRSSCVPVIASRWGIRTDARSNDVV
jgi:hypothetical protein